MGLALFKGKETDPDESPTISAAAHEDSEKTIHIKYNLRKRKHEVEHNEKDAKRTKSSSNQRMSKTRQSRQRKDQQSAQLTKRAKTRTRKLTGNNVQRTGSSVSKKTSKLSANKRTIVQTNSIPKTDKTSELKQKVQSKGPSTRKRNNNRNRAASNTRKNTEILSKTKSQLKSNTRISSKGLAEKLQKARQSSGGKRKSTLPPNNSYKKETVFDSFRKTQAKDCKTLNKSTRKMLLKNNNFVAKQSIEITAQINVGIESQIYGICVTNDNLIWINYLLNHVKLFDTSGNVLRSVDLEQSPVFNCCTPNGNVLFTQGYARGARPEIMMVPQKGNQRKLADLSSYAWNLCGILCKDGKIYVIGHGRYNSPGKHFVIKLDMNGRVEGTYEATETVKFNNIILQQGRIFVISLTGDLLPLENDRISASPMNKVNIVPVCSTSACVDNFGNVIFGYKSDISVIDPCLQRLCKKRTKISDSILSTVVDHKHQLWIGTNTGIVYIANYMK